MKLISENELARVEGGLPFWAGVIVGGLIYDLISDPESLVNGFKDGVRDGWKLRR